MSIRRLSHPALSAIPFLLALLLCGCLFVFGQGNDTPIIISDGSLNVNATVAWANFTNVNASTKAHPQGGKSVTQVVATVNGNTQTFDFSNQQCTVAIQYAGTDLTVTTNPTGRGLRVVTDYGSFNTNGNVMSHKNPNSKISKVTISRAGQTVLTASPSGGTRIAISYR